MPDGSPIEATSKALSRRRKTKQLAGTFEGRALELVEVARSLDLAIARFKVARPALAQAVAAWNEALAQLPKTVEQPSTNGTGPADAAPSKSAPRLIGKCRDRRTRRRPQGRR